MFYVALYCDHKAVREVISGHFQKPESDPWAFGNENGVISLILDSDARVLTEYPV